MVTIDLLKFGVRKPWVARIAGESATYGFAREFVEPRIIGNRYFFDLPDGFFEIKSRGPNRQFIEVRGTASREVSSSDVKAWVAERAAERVARIAADDFDLANNRSM